MRWPELVAAPEWRPHCCNPRLTQPSTLALQDVWDVCWASDDPEALAVMEKGRLVVLRGSEADEPISSSAWLAGFADLQVCACM